MEMILTARNSNKNNFTFFVFHYIKYKQKTNKQTNKQTKKKNESLKYLFDIFNAFFTNIETSKALKSFSFLDASEMVHRYFFVLRCGQS